MLALRILSAKMSAAAGIMLMMVLGMAVTYAESRHAEGSLGIEARKLIFPEELSMSMGWYLNSFDYHAFEQLIGSNDQVLANQFCESVKEELEDAELTSVAERAILDGIDYDRLSEDQAEEMDELVRFIFEEEPLDNHLGIEFLNEDFVPQLMLQALLSYSQKTPTVDRFSQRVLKFFCTGRRLGETSPHETCGYVVLSLPETEQVSASIEKIISMHPAEEGHWCPDALEQQVLAPLHRCIASKRELAMTFG